MKKSLAIISALCLLLCTRSSAQTGLEVGIRFNPEFTEIMNRNDLDAGDQLDYASHFTYISFGFGAIYNINNNIGLGVDLLFSREGQAFTGNFNGAPLDSAAYSSVVTTQTFLNDVVITGNYKALAELNYVKLPLMLSLTSDNTKPLFFTMLVGPQFNFLEGVAQEVNGEDLEYPNTDINLKDLYQPVTISGMLAVGGAYHLMTRVVLSAQIRFDYGFNDSEKKDAMVSYFGADAVRFYSAERTTARALTTGLMIGVNYKLQ